MWFQDHDVTCAGSVRTQPLPLSSASIVCHQLLHNISILTGISTPLLPVPMPLLGGRKQLIRIFLSLEWHWDGIFHLPSPLEEEGNCRCLASPGGSGWDLPCEALPGFVTSQDRVG